MNVLVAPGTRTPVNPDCPSMVTLSQAEVGPIVTVIARAEVGIGVDLRIALGLALLDAANTVGLMVGSGVF